MWDDLKALIMILLIIIVLLFLWGLWTKAFNDAFIDQQRRIEELVRNSPDQLKFH